MPRILLISPGHHPPELIDVYEDWVHPSVPPGDLQVRVQAVQSRREAFSRPQVDPHGGLMFQGSRLEISPTQVDLVSCLVRSYGHVVLRATLADCLPGAGGDSDRRNVLDLHMGRLRRKLTPLGLTVSTVWGCGYALDCDDPDATLCASAGASPEADHLTVDHSSSR